VAGGADGKQSIFQVILYVYFEMFSICDGVCGEVGCLCFDAGADTL